MELILAISVFEQGHNRGDLSILRWELFLRLNEWLLEVFRGLLSHEKSNILKYIIFER
jgi:hypothetical protein